LNKKLTIKESILNILLKNSEFGQTEDDILKKVHINLKRNVEPFREAIKQLTDNSEIVFYKGYFFIKNYKPVFNNMEKNLLSVLKTNFIFLKEINYNYLKKFFFNIDELFLSKLLIKLQFDGTIIKIKKNRFLFLQLYKNYLDIFKKKCIINIKIVKFITGLKHEEAVVLKEYYEKVVL